MILTIKGLTEDVRIAGILTYRPYRQERIPDGAFKSALQGDAMKSRLPRRDDGR